MSSTPSQFWILRKTAPEASASNKLFRDALHISETLSYRRTRVLMSVLNLGEVFYHSWQAAG